MNVDLAARQAEAEREIARRRRQFAAGKLDFSASDTFSSGS